LSFAERFFSGGKASLIIQFLGDGFFGDEIPPTTLAEPVDLELALAIEPLVVPHVSPDLKDSMLLLHEDIHLPPQNGDQHD
jgi:hypothetical protein